MAGGKETPRQKLINLMYLVLLAMLALQVGATVLEKFITLNQSLERAVADADNKNTQTLQRIEKAVEDAGNRKEDVAVLNKAKEVRKLTADALGFVDQLKEELIERTGGKKESGMPIGLKDEGNTATLMLNDGRGDELKKVLNQFAEDLSKLTGKEYPKIALDGDEHPLFENDSENRRKSFAKLNFESTPMGAALATLTQFQTEVATKESDALETIARQVGAADLKFDQILARVTPESKYVAAGTKYQADLFIAASSSSVNPTMMVDGREIPVDGGIGKIEFTATAGNYDSEGNAKKSFKAEITINQAGKDTTFTNDVEYFVVRPVIQVQSQSVSALYLNCGNELNIQVPALGNAYQPSFNAQGGSAMAGSKRGEVTIVPNTSKVTVSVSSGGNLIGTETFNVRRVPKPDVKIFNNGKPFDERRGTSTSGLGALEIRAIPDESFAQFLPKDARYRVSDAVATLVRGSNPVTSTPVRNGRANLADFRGQARAGDRIVIEVKNVQRANFQNQTENVNLGGPVFFNIPLN
ncbi:MAG: gliding motility protein GldM [Cyclobacteriaceae bacterium]|nr:gliding motility protein GldM [Cyclobacteriaceae bacterium]MCH8515041.1 gliding motility protein GldM [Cyclobacteriaceae bacterium]